MRLELSSQPVEPFLVIGDAMVRAYGNALVDNFGYTLCYFHGTSMIFSCGWYIWVSGFFFIFYLVFILHTGLTVMVPKMRNIYPWWE